MKTTSNPSQVHCRNEYDILKKVIICEPKFMAIKEAVNYSTENLDCSLALLQHQKFEETLRNAGVEVIKLQPREDYPEQVFTRDIGFALGSHLFIAEMANSIRQGEEEVLVQWLNQHDIIYKNLSTHSIEGGDVIIDGNRVFVGISDRTSKKAIQNLQKELPEFEIIAIPFNPKYLHLDCVFNILSTQDALIYTDAFNQKTVELLASRYNLIEVSESEQSSLGTNVLSVGRNCVISLPNNLEVNKQMTQHGYDVVEVDFSEIIKSNGSFRCCSLPILRQ